jgi:formylmethanofuran dehydrogenase subunit D
MRYKEWDVKIIFSKYNNDRVAIVLVDAIDGEQIAVGTVNIPEAPIANDEVIIKDYSENEGMLQFLIDNKIVENTGNYIDSGFVSCPVCKILSHG